MRVDREDTPLEAVELAFSSITVKSSRGKIVSKGALRNPAPNTLTIDLEPLEPGTYRISL
jgi:hypothetical protein